MKRIKYKDRFKRRACPICGCTEIEYNYGYAEYPKVWNWDTCAECGCVVGYEDNSPWHDLWHDIKKEGIRSKKKVLEFIRYFYEPNKRIRTIIK